MNKKVVLGVPTTRDFCPGYVKSLFVTQSEDEIAFAPTMGMAVDDGRNRVVRQFLESFKSFDFLLMHDSDAVWSSEAVQRMINHNLPMVTGMIFKRSYPTTPTIGKLVSVSPEGNYMYSFTGTKNKILEVIQRNFGELPIKQNDFVLPFEKDQIQEVDGCGAHFFLVRRDVLEAIPFPWFQCTRDGAGEDFDFCRKVKKAGFKIFADFGIYTGHNVGGTIDIGVKEFLKSSDKQEDTLWIM